MTAADTQPETAQQTFKVGAFPGMSFKDYLKVPAMNHSTLAYGHKSMRRLRMHEEGGRGEKPSSAMAFGTHAHVAIWEMPRYLKEYVHLPEIKEDKPGKYTNFKSTKEYKGKLAELKKNHPGKVCLTHEDGNMISGIVAAIDACPDAKERIRADGPHEISIFWFDGPTGVPCKARLDKFIDDEWPVVPDLKATADPYPDGFSRIARNLRYFDKAAWYLSGVKSVYGVDAMFDLIAIGQKPPHDCYVYRVNDVSLRQGRRNNAQILQRYVWCKEHDEWPSGPPGVRDIGLPAWALDDDISDEEPE